MWKDPIVAEVRAAREQYSAQFGNNLRKIGRDLQRKQESPAVKTKKAGATRRAPAKRKAA